MDFRHSEDQLAFYKSVLDFAAENVEPGAHERDVEGRFDRDLWSKLGGFGSSDFRCPNSTGAREPTSSRPAWRSRLWPKVEPTRGWALALVRT